MEGSVGDWRTGINISASICDLDAKLVTFLNCNITNMEYIDLFLDKQTNMLSKTETGKQVDQILHGIVKKNCSHK